MHHPHHASDYSEFLALFFWSDFPVTFTRDMTVFQKPSNMSTNVDFYNQENKLFYPMQLAKEEIKDRHVGLALTNDQLSGTTKFSGSLPSHFHWACKRSL